MWARSGCGSHYFIRDNAVPLDHQVQQFQEAAAVVPGPAGFFGSDISQGAAGADQPLHLQGPDSCPPALSPRPWRNRRASSCCTPGWNGKSIPSCQGEINRVFQPPPELRQGGIPSRGRKQGCFQPGPQGSSAMRQAPAVQQAGWCAVSQLSVDVEPPAWRGGRRSLGSWIRGSQIRCFKNGSRVTLSICSIVGISTRGCPGSCQPHFALRRFIRGPLGANCEKSYGSGFGLGFGFPFFRLAGHSSSWDSSWAGRLPLRVAPHFMSCSGRSPASPQGQHVVVAAHLPVLFRISWMASLVGSSQATHSSVSLPSAGVFPPVTQAPGVPVVPGLSRPPRRPRVFGCRQ